ncbi:MAG: M3 family oligoendopeptidase [Actinomycetota bacterium]
MTETLELPRWDMSVVFPSLDSPEFETEFKAVIDAVRSLKDLFDRNGVRKTDDSSVDVATFDEVLGQQNQLSERVRTLGAYVSSFITTDSRDDYAQGKISELQGELIVLTKLGKRFEAWVGSLDVEKLISESALASDHAFVLRKAKRSSEHLMPEGEEDLAADLSLSGSLPWSRLHNNVASRLLVDVEKPSGAETLPMSAVRALAHDPDASVRQAAFKAELKAWETVSVPLAAAMNSIKGTANTLNQRRGWADSLEPALFNNNIDREILEAMQSACTESFPDFRRYLKAKASLLGKPTMAFWDLFAPVGGAESSRRWDYDDAKEFIVSQFATFSDRLSGLADRAFKENWVDVSPRLGKTDGAFCMGLRGEESRVLLNFEPSFDSVGTLAHELGHAYHNLNLAKRTPAQRATPMALAETASIFCQTIITNAVLVDASDEEKLSILENDLQDACQVTVDIHSRFIFEKSVFEGRERRELSVEELCNNMLDAQKQTYGDGLDPDELHPYMWAMKPHYYGSSYYNWPYTFGLLFGLGLYAQFGQDPDKFRGGYDDLLSSTGLADAAELGKRFEIDFRSPDFWRSSLDVIRERVVEFETLAKRFAPGA